MYLKKIRLQNIKCFEDVTLEFPHTDGDYSGWNVILGENGLGKSSIARAIAELVMEFHASSWLYDDDWVSASAEEGEIIVWFIETTFDDPELRGGGSERGPTAGTDVSKSLTLKAEIERRKLEWDLPTRRPKKINTPGWLRAISSPGMALTSISVEALPTSVYYGPQRRGRNLGADCLVESDLCSLT
ncbi:AAA ATPase OS=Candidatus Contendobacter odensis Run_B_J11 GN=BN874_1680007 PE=4 SV=1: AAA_23 [Gemmata massiliana]|uniref:Rad50/SbcC-type AAA domain-containing protein n=1 Tax=Gemmata massiliana TaxID=1210884 RepID=A0A6P2DIW4_9BACT|nr:AAA family ATPase [Gemmata massiliana]VTS02064.1 AAA ATPase OS=Candidatus Contendobacter odensis Run_B_J11 GN=BN874_1680007 PE=4 SV=1: AAA_23 [Gemmata massiliana]